MRRLALSSSLFLAACTSGSGAPVFGTTPMAQLVGDTGAVHVAVYSAPDPVTRGNDEFRYVITDAGGAPIDGLSVTVTPWMPAMGHGASTTPTVAAEGQGKYLVSNVVLVMAGDWQLRSQVSGSVNDTFTVTFSVP